MYGISTNSTPQKHPNPFIYFVSTYTVVLDTGNQLIYSYRTMFYEENNNGHIKSLQTNLS